MAIYDITVDVEKVLLSSSISDGLCVVYSPHTTFSVMINEHESGLFADYISMLERLAPRREDYVHDDLLVRTENLVEDEPPNGQAHLKHMLAGRASEYVPVAGGQLLLGRWQRIMAVELDDVRSREIVVQVLGT